MRRPEISMQSIRWLVAELVIVVLGILIAFQVEEWRENSFNNDFVLSSLNAVIVELEDELSDIQNAVPSLDQQMLSASSLFNLLKAEGNRDSSELSKYFRGVFSNYGFRQNAPTYTGLRESGRLYLISDPDLIDQMFDYYEYGEYVDSYFTSTDETRDTLREASFLDFRRIPENLNLSNSINSDAGIELIYPIDEIPRNPEFLSILGIHMVRISNAIERLEDISARNVSLQKSINAYISNN